MTIISPVNVEANAFLAAGSTITKDVPSKALGIARSRQENKDGFGIDYQLVKRLRLQIF